LPTELEKVPESHSIGSDEANGQYDPAGQISPTKFVEFTIKVDAKGLSVVDP
jgi:hypothetical protein